jgi:hypothetical protein
MGEYFCRIVQGYPDHPIDAIITAAYAHRRIQIHEINSEHCARLRRSQFFVFSLSLTILRR